MSGSGTGTPISTVTAVVVEDGTGKSTANSYLSVADADTYHANYTRSSDWTGATETVRQNSLIVATQYLDITYQGRWRGYKNTAAQSLAWPRYCVEDDDGFYLDANSLPQKLKDACAELALRVVLGDDLLGVVTTTGEVIAESVSVGPVSQSKSYASPKSHHNQYPRINGLLKALVDGGGFLSRG